MIWKIAIFYENAYICSIPSPNVIISISHWIASIQWPNKFIANLKYALEMLSKGVSKANHSKGFFCISKRDTKEWSLVGAEEVASKKLLTKITLPKRNCFVGKSIYPNPIRRVNMKIKQGWPQFANWSFCSLYKDSNYNTLRHGCVDRK